MSSRIAKGDVVAVVSGDDRGRRGRVLRVIPDKNRVVVEGVNLVFKHLRRSQQNPQGGRIRKEAPIHISNVMPIDPETNRPTRIAMREANGRRYRVGSRSGAALDATGGAKGGKKSEPAKRGAGKDED